MLFMEYLFFGHGIRLSSSEMKDYLNAAFVLENNEPISSQITAINKVKEMTSLQKVSFLPLLLEIFLSNTRREYYKRNNSRDSLNLFLKECRDVINSLFTTEVNSNDKNHFGKGNNKLRPCPLPNMINNLEKVSLEEVPVNVSSYLASYELPQTGISDTYLEADYYAPEIFLLSLLFVAFKENKDWLEGVDFEKLVIPSLNCNYGLFPWQMALYIHAYQVENIHNLIKYFPNGNWKSIPCCIKVLLYYLLDYSKETRINNDFAQDILLESWNWNIYQSFLGDSISSWMIDRGTTEEIQLLEILIWQIVCWDISYEYNANECVGVLANYWYTPSFNNNWKSYSALHKNNLINDIQRKVISNTYTRIYGEESIPNATTTPWLHCSDENIAQEKESYFNEFPHFIKPYIALRNFYAAVFLRRAFSCNSISLDHSQIINLCRTLINMGDAYDSDSAIKQLKEGVHSNIWSSTLRGFFRFAYYCVESLGKGRVSDTLPYHIVEIMTRQKNYSNIELIKLQSGRSLMVGAKWAAECLAEIDNINNINNYAWFSKSGTNTASGAERVCSLLLERDYLRATRSKYIQELMVQLYNDNLVDMSIQYEDHWMNRLSPDVIQYQTDEDIIQLPDVIFYPKLNFDDWKSIRKYIHSSSFEPAAWIVILTRNLKTIIQSYDSPNINLSVEEINKYIEHWSNEISSINPSVVKSNPLILFELCLLLKTDSHTVAPSSFPSITQIAEIVIDVVFDYIREDCLFYIGTLADILSCTDITYPFKLIDRQNIVKCMVIHFYKSMETGIIPESLIRRYLYSVRCLLEENSIYNIKEAIDRYFYEKSTKSQIGALVDINENEWEPLTDRFLQKNLEKITVVRLQQDITKDKANNDILNPFIKKEISENKDRQIGIIYKKRRFQLQRDTRDQVKRIEYIVKTINDYIKVTIIYPTTHVKNEYRLGDLVSLKAKDSGQYEIYPLAWKMEETDKTIYVTSPKYYFSEKPPRTIFEYRLPNGQKMMFPHYFKTNNIFDFEKTGEYLNYWVPDIVSSINNRIKFSKNMYEVVFDSTYRTYIPVKRNFLQLMIEQVFISENTEHTIDLTYIKSEKRQGKTFDLFSVFPGENYLINRDRWIDDCFSEILNKNANNTGLKIFCNIIVKDNDLYLTFSPDTGVIFDNILYRDAFNDGDSIIAKYSKEKHGYYTSLEIRDNNYSLRIMGNIISRNSAKTFVVNPNGWNSYRQRCCQISCEGKRAFTLNKQACNVESIDAILSIKTGDIVHLNKIIYFGARAGYYTGLLNNGITVLCAADSLTLTSETNGPLFQDRECIVENIHSFHNRESEQDAIPVEIPELGSLSKVLGIVGKYVYRSEDETVTWELWILNGEDVNVITIPSSSFCNYPKSQGSTVIGEQTPDGKWIFKAENKNIYIRALWKLEDHIQKPEYLDKGILLGQSIYVQGKGICTLTQDEYQPVIHLWNTSQTIRNNQVCGLDSSEGTIVRKDYLHSDPSIFTYVKNRDLVFLQQKDRMIWGISKNYEFDVPHYNWDVEIMIRVPLSIHGTGYYDVRRIFHIDHSVEKSPEGKGILADQETYNAWLKGDRHVYGKLEGAGIRLTDLKIPEHVSANSIIDKYTDYVSFNSEEDMSFVTLNKRYPYGNTIRAVLEMQDDVWYASCTKVIPFKLDAGLVGEFHAIDHQIIHQHIYFAGNDNHDNFLFEWGYGFIFCVNKKDLINENQNQIGNDLFYGDLISEFSFVKSPEGTYGWKIQIPEGAIERQLTYQLWNDSFKNDVIQILKVSINRKTHNVKIHEISFVNYNVNIQSEMNGWTFRKMQHINLDQESTNRIISEEGDVIEDRIILAALDERIKENKNNKPVFKYISLDDADMNPYLLGGKTICMEAQEIKRTGGSNNNLYPANDYCLQFVLPGNRDFITSVIRRGFSFDESKLRIAVSNGEQDKYLGKMMLVTILNKDPKMSHNWNGSVIGRIRRSTHGLKEWVRKDKSCLVVLGKEKDGVVPIEIAPGIICQLNASVFKDHTSHLEYGSIASLFLDRTNNGDETIGAKIVFPSDLNYFSELGRAVEILPMDGATRHYLQGYFKQRRITEDVDDKEDVFEHLKNDRRHFSIAGFPQLTIMNYNEMINVMKEPIPRTRFVRKRGDSYIIDNNKQYVAASIKIDNSTSQPSLKYLVPFQTIEVSEWSQLSFLDDTVQNIRRFTENGRWHYHDKETVIYNSKMGRYYKASLPEGLYNEVVVFPDEWGMLRYRDLSTIISNGYSAREVCENGLSNKDQFYPIASVTDNSLWVEMMPGRIVEIPKDYLFIGLNHIALSSFVNQSLCTGDLIKLDDTMESFSGGQRVLLLIDFKIGLRSFLGRTNSYLPVLGVLEGSGLLLGGAGLQLIYPVSNSSEWYGQSLVCLDNNNRLKKIKGNINFNVGDTIFLETGSDNKIRIRGLKTSFRMVASAREKWKNSGWIFNIMTSPFFANIFLNMFSLPVKIDEIDKKKHTIYYSFSQRNMNLYPEKSIISGVCIGTFKGGDNNWRVLIRSGNTLIRIKYEHFIDGITNPLDVSNIVKAIAENGIGLWFYKHNDGEWRSGIVESLDEQSPRVKLLFPVFSSNGIVCQSLSTKRIYWLPAERASRAGKVPLQEVWILLQNRTIRNTIRLPNRQLSIIDTTSSMQQFVNLHKGNQRYHLTPYLRLKNNLTNKTKWIYLSELFPLGDIVVLESEYSISIDTSKNMEPIAVELLFKRPNHITMVPYGTYRLTQHLPSWFNSSLNNIRYLGHYNVRAFKNRINIRYVRYSEHYMKGVFDARNKSIEFELFKIHKNTSSKNDYRTELKCRICYLAGIISNTEMHGIEKIKYQVGIEYIRQWINDEGKNILSSSHHLQDQTGFFVDLLPLLSIIDILNEIGKLYKETDIILDQDYSEAVIIASQVLAVHLTRIVGLLSENSIHFEVLIRDWLYQDRNSYYWNCLNYLSIGGINYDGTDNNAFSGQLLPDQVESIRTVCNHISRLDYHSDLGPLLLIRDCLLYSIGELHDYSEFLDYFQLSKQKYVTVRMARLGHLLTPAAYSRDPAIDALTDEMITIIRKIENEIAINKYPLVIMNEYYLPLKDNERVSIEDSISTIINRKALNNG